ncbi:hypothetical protein LY90DRAFT_638996 [Neocallimastix californiae]|uniref:Uncharacterized protein n=1 Tax=Neocallimastix californiae TaxID=1754190 RepID=A0A1Y2EG60_9FUNG|nr:hypothetical protein LY90DRAFT_638996 [Neocallimastix californiae]|eukprot:ORY70561.1 hypothetical protein LY90DRAFT_638996 [Neocallimastix californiae]
MELKKLENQQLSLNEIKVLNDYGLQYRLSSDKIDKLKKKIEMKEKEKEIILNGLKLLKKHYFIVPFQKKYCFVKQIIHGTLPYYQKKKKRNNYISKKEYYLERIKVLSWIPIIPYSEEINEQIDNEKYNIDRKYILISC